LGSRSSAARVFCLGGERAAARRGLGAGAMPGILEKIAALEHEMSITQKNKATSTHLGSLKAKLCALRRELLDPVKAGGKKVPGFEVQRYGNSRVALIGFPSVGKSSLLTALTGVESEAADYEFTTLTCIP